MEKDLVEIGIIVAAHGIKGEVKVKTFIETPEAIKTFPNILMGKDKKPIKLKLCGVNKGQALVSIDLVKTRNEAELLAGTSLYIKREELPETEESEFYQHDLIGLEVKDIQGKEFGSVLGFQNFGGGDLVEIKMLNGKAEFFLFNKSSFPEIDIKKGYITINPPEII